MSQNTLKVHDLNEDAEFDENGVEAFDEKALSEEEPSDNDLAEEELLSQGATQRVLDATQLYLGEIGYSPLLTAEEEVYFARRALRGDVASRRRMIESNLRLVVKIARRYGNRGLVKRENDPLDKRRRFVYLTVQGQTLLAAAIPLGDRVDDEFLGRLSAEEREQFTQLVRKMMT